LPRAALDKSFAEGLRGFAESLGLSAKQLAPVVIINNGIEKISHTHTQVYLAKLNYSTKNIA
jgi:hypothetical protein